MFSDKELTLIVYALRSKAFQKESVMLRLRVKEMQCKIVQNMIPGRASCGQH